MPLIYELASCVMCDQEFWCYPRLVPRVTALRPSEPLPVCLECVEIANIRRQRAGREPIEIPPGAYNRGLTLPEEKKRWIEWLDRHQDPSLPDADAAAVNEEDQHAQPGVRE